MVREKEKFEQVKDTVLTSQFSQGGTLEDFVERALVHLIEEGDLATSIQMLESGYTAESIFERLIEELNLTETVTNDVLVESSRTEISKRIQDAISQYDGFNRENLFFSLLLNLLQEFPYRETFKIILEHKDLFVEKIETLLSFIFRNKSQGGSSSGIKSFLSKWGNECDIRQLENGDISADEAVARTILMRRDKIKFVFCGEGGRFDCYRVKMTANPEDGIMWDYTDLVLKAMKQKNRSKSAQFGLLRHFEREHQVVEDIFGSTYVPDTLFEQPTSEELHREIDQRRLVFQEYINGSSILEACKDPFLSERLRIVLPRYITRYEDLARREGKVIDCPSIAKRNVLVHRKVVHAENPKNTSTDELRIYVIDTNNLIEVGSRRWEKMYIDRKTGKPHYLYRLRQYVEDGALLDAA